MLPMTQDLWGQLRQAHRQVNASTAYKSDPEHYGEPDYWEPPIDGLGDCEDYALGYARRLEAWGWPRESLRVATCWDEKGEYHAVLTVDTDHGTWVLDNRQPAVMGFEDAPYTWDKREVPGKLMWEKIA